MKTFPAFLALLFFALFIFPSCEKAVDDKKAPPASKSFDMDAFQDNIEDGLGNQWAGYGYVISKDGQLSRSGEFGKRRGPNEGNVDFEISSPVYAASVGKVITAVALLRLLEIEGNGDAEFMLNAKVYNYLPPNWNFGPNTTNITFRNLFQHQSGIDVNAGFDYDELRTLFATGTPASKPYEYSNANYGLMRILVARMSGNADNIEDLNNDEEAGNIVLNGFKRYVDTQLLNPLDIDASTQPFGTSPALYYAWSDLTQGWNMGDMTNRLGNGGWYISPLDFAKFMAYLNHSEEFFSADTREVMFENFLGWGDGSNPANAPLGDYGRYYFKGGSFCSSAQDGVCNGQGVRNIAAVFPHNGVEVIIMGNSRGGNMDTGTGLSNMLLNAYDDAWK